MGPWERLNTFLVQSWVREEKPNCGEQEGAGLLKGFPFTAAQDTRAPRISSKPDWRRPAPGRGET